MGSGWKTASFSMTFEILASLSEADMDWLAPSRFNDLTRLRREAREALFVSEVIGRPC